MLVLLVLAIGLVGWIVNSLLSCDSSSMGTEHGWITRWVRDSFVVFLAGFGTTSLILFILATVGWFSKSVILAFAGLLLLLFVLKRLFLRDRSGSVRFFPYVVFCFLLAAAVSGWGKVAPPYETILFRDDASVYLGTAFQLARLGSIPHQDLLVLEMSREVKDIFFRMNTGDYARFPGGVNLMNPANGTVTFGFYHLLPVWLAFGIRFLGMDDFLNLTSLFFILVLLSSFMLGRRLGGPLVGWAMPAILLAFYPQIYFARMPLSEGLAQTMFLSGLWIFLGQSSDTMFPAGQQRLAAILFGNMFLARVDALFFIPVAMIFIFSLISPLRRNIGEWRFFWAWLVLFALLALYHQFINDTYLFLYILSWQKTGQLWTQAAVVIAKFVLNHPFASLVIFICICVVVVFTSRFWVPRGKSLKSIRIRTIVGLLLGSGLLLAFFENKFRWSRFWSHFAWFNPLFPDWLAAVLLIGLVLFLYVQERNKECKILWSLPLLMIIPAMCYIDRSFMMPEQPWLMRRFTPIVFPLFFLMSFAGWFLFLKKTFSHRRWIPPVVFAVIVFSCIAVFWRTSWYLFRMPLYQNVITQTKALAAKLPKDCLLLLPSSQGGIHFQIPLQFMLGYDTLLLRMEEGINRTRGNLVRAFLRDQLSRGRPVIVIVQRPLGATWPNVTWPVTTFLRGLRVQFAYAKEIRFHVVSDSPPNVLLDHADPIALQFRIFTVRLNQ